MHNEEHGEGMFSANVWPSVDPREFQVSWTTPPPDWPYRAQAPDDHLSHDRVMWIIRRCGPTWTDTRFGTWYSNIAWKDDGEVMEFWFRDGDIFTEFTLVWC